MRNLLYRLYERRLEAELAPQNLPGHVAVILDGNRRWAERRGAHSARHGHTAGALKTLEFIAWCDDLEIPVITLYLLSTDNLTGRASQELDELLQIIGDLAEAIGELGTRRIHVVGDKAALPSDLAARLESAEAATAAVSGSTVNLAVGYGGRLEIADAMRAILHQQAAEGASIEDVANRLTPELIAANLYTSGQPDPDLVIRTSGEQRLSGFLTWQSANSEFYFEEALWPDFRRVDFLRALRAFQLRHRRFGA